MNDSNSNALPIGYILNNKYKIIGKLGEGGFGITYLAEETTLHHKVAIKEFMPREHANRSQMNNSISPYTDKIGAFNHLIKRFEEEAKLLVGLKHPNIVRVWELFKANNTVYMVMDYEEGETLNSYLKKYPRLNENEIINIMNPVFEAIKYVHSKGILHRDIAPDNIYMRENGTPMVIDFGSARDVIAKYSKDITSIVKEGYSPPEQYSTTNQSPPTDIYALGAVLYRMMSGKRPVSSQKRQHSAYSEEKDPLENIATLCNNRYGQKLIDVVNMAMNLKTQNRFQTIDEMQKALFQGVTPTKPFGQETTPTQPRPRPTPQPIPMQPIPNNNNLKMVFGLIGVIVVLAIVMISMDLGHSDYPPEENTTVEENTTELVVIEENVTMVPEDENVTVEANATE
jgi:serine/threonine protein kinase